MTGGSSGIGAAICEHLAAAGATVCVNYRSDLEEAEGVIAKIEAVGGKAFAVRADVSDEGQVRQL